MGRIYLRPIATELDRITVEAEEVRLFPQLADFYRRKQEGFAGQFITREDLERSGVRRTSEALRRGPRMQLDCPVDPVKSGDQCVVRNQRYRDIRPANTGRRPQTGDLTESGAGYNLLRCEMDIFVDGQRSSLKVDEVPLDRIAAIEVYSGPATTPAAFGMSRCGVVAIWTKRPGQ